MITLSSCGGNSGNESSTQNDSLNTDPKETDIASQRDSTVDTIGDSVVDTSGLGGDTSLTQ